MSSGRSDPLGRLAGVYGCPAVARSVRLYFSCRDRGQSAPPVGLVDPCPRLSRLDGDKVFLYDARSRLLAVFRVRPCGKLHRLRDLAPYQPSSRHSPDLAVGG